MTNNAHTFNKNNKNLTHVILRKNLRFVNFSKKNSKAYKLKFTCALRFTLIESNISMYGFQLKFNEQHVRRRFRYEALYDSSINRNCVPFSYRS